MKKARGRWNVICAAAVGMNEQCQTYDKLLTEANQASFPLFYLRGGLDKSKLRGFNGMMINMLAEDLEKSNKPENAEMIKLLKSGADYFSEENLAGIIAFTLDKI